MPYRKNLEGVAVEYRESYGLADNFHYEITINYSLCSLIKISLLSCRAGSLPFMVKYFL